MYGFEMCGVESVGTLVALCYKDQSSHKAFHFILAKCPACGHHPEVLARFRPAFDHYPEVLARFCPLIRPDLKTILNFVLRVDRSRSDG
ncbi:unnamed protein product [Periconia digitata]|uniref:Uncharacterized protein n=1 Tax=Periconia digitata TaxID=1303443 RepID=A0A9W4UCU9_9PLEO|nr:unnamed protein product [Periconia digitata]